MKYILKKNNSRLIFISYGYYFVNNSINNNSFHKKIVVLTQKNVYINNFDIYTDIIYSYYFIWTFCSFTVVAEPSFTKK